MPTMPDWVVAVIYVVATSTYSLIARHRKSSGRDAPSLVFFPVAALATGAAIGDWWAAALGLQGALVGILLLRHREPMRMWETVLVTAFDGALIALGCALVRAF
jgi:hypothetical protein